MSCYILCPECGYDLGCVFPAFKTLQASHNLLCCGTGKNIHPDKIDIKPNAIKDIGYILNALKINNICCRMHVICYVDFDNIHKGY